MKIFIILILSVLVLSVCISVSGCKGQGHTASELRRERTRTFKADNQAMYDDLERALMIDRPSRLTNKSIR